MNGKTTIALVIVVVMVIAVGAYAATTMGNGTGDSNKDTAENYTANVWLNIDGEYIESEGTGTTVREVISDATGNAHSVDIRSNGTIASVDDVSADEGKQWALFQWGAYEGWKVTTVGATADKSLVDGTSYCVMMSEQTTVDGKTGYSVPDKEPVSTCWFFIAFEDDYDVESVLGVYTEEERKNGFWISGEGSDVAEAFSDACEKAGFQLNLVYKGELRGWFGSFLGLEDEQIDSSLWKYWAQYHWDGDSWEYDDYTIGYYDPGVNGYFAFVRQITEEKGADTDITVTPEDCPGWTS